MDVRSIVAALMEPEAGDKRKSTDVHERPPFFVTFYMAAPRSISLPSPSNRVLLLDFRSSMRYRVRFDSLFLKKKERERERLVRNFEIKGDLQKEFSDRNNIRFDCQLLYYSFDFYPENPESLGVKEI